MADSTGKPTFISLSEAKESVFAGKSFVIHGYDDEKSQALISTILNYGGKVTTEIDSSTSFLITTPAEARFMHNPLIQTAISHGIPVVSETFIWQCLTASPFSDSTSQSSSGRLGPGKLRLLSENAVDSLNADLESNRSFDYQQSEVERLLLPFSNSVSVKTPVKSPFGSDMDNEAVVSSTGNIGNEPKNEDYLWYEPPPAAIHSQEEYFNDSDDQESISSHSHSISPSDTQRKFQLFPLVPPVTNNHVEQRLEWQRLLCTYLTGDEVEKERLRREKASLDKSAKANTLWLAINAKLSKMSVSDYTKQLDLLRNEAVGVLMDCALRFNINEDISFSYESIYETLFQYQECKSLFPSNAGFMSYLTQNGVDAEKLMSNIIDPLQSWLNLTELMQMIVSCIRHDYKVEDNILGIPHEIIQDLLESRSISNLFSRQLFETIDKACDKFHESISLYGSKWSLAHLESLMPLASDICQFPLILMKSCLNYWIFITKNLISSRVTNEMEIKITEENQNENDQLLMSITQFLDDLRESINVALREKAKYTMRITSLQESFGKKTNTYSSILDSFNEQLELSLSLYIELLREQFMLGKHGFWYRNQKLLDNEWDYLKNVSNGIPGSDVKIVDCILTLIYQSVYSVSFWVQTVMHPPSEPLSNGKLAIKVYSRLLEHVQLRSRKLLQFIKSIKYEMEKCIEVKLDLSMMKMNDVVSKMIEIGFCVKHIEGIDDFLMICEQNLTVEEIENCFTFNWQSQSNPQKSNFVLLLRKSVVEITLLNIENVKLTRSNEFFTIKPTETIGDSSLLLLSTENNTVEESMMRLSKIFKSFYISHRFTGNRTTINALINSRMGKIDRSVVRFLVMIIRCIPKIRLYLTSGPLDADDTGENENSLIVDLLANYFSFFSSLGRQSLVLLPGNYRSYLIKYLIELAVEWINFTCSDCSPMDKKTFRWALMALEFVMWVTRGGNILALSEEAFNEVRRKVACCMTLLISGINSSSNNMVNEGNPEDYENDYDALTAIEAAVNEVLQKEEEMLNPKECVNSIFEIDCKRDKLLQDSKRIGRVLDTSNPGYEQLMNLLTASVSKVSIRWQQGKFLGGGAYGQVHLGINMDTGDLLAVKEIHFNAAPLHAPEISKTSQHSQIDRISEEVRVLERLNHNNVVQYYGIEIHKDKCLLFMEYCSNGSLRTLLDGAGRIEDESVVILYAFELLEGVRYLHENGIIHRDIKPDNILFDHMGTLKLVDFGAAKIMQKTSHLFEKTKAKASLTGTACYLAPEVVTGKVECGRFGAQDIWSSGCVIVEMVTGKRPWSNLDNEWAILYNIGLSNKHPQLPERKSLNENQGKDSTHAYPIMSDTGVDLVQSCFSNAEKRPAADELLKNEYFDELRIIYPSLINRKRTFQLLSSDKLESTLFSSAADTDKYQQLFNES